MNFFGSNAFIPGFQGNRKSNDPLLKWLQEFPQDQKNEIEAWLNENSAGVWVVRPIPLLAEFRLSPFRALELIFKTLEHLWKILPPPGRIVWALENNRNLGLDDFEAEAIFSKWVVIHDLVQINQGKEGSKIILAGTFRQERIGVSFVLPDIKFSQIRNLSNIFSIFEEAKVPVAGIFLSSPAAKKMTRNPAYFWLKTKIRHLLENQSVSLGLWIPKERTENGLLDIEGEIRPLKQLGKFSHTPRLIRFEEVEAISSQTALAKSLMDSSIECDCSMISTGWWDKNSEITQNLQGPYFLAGAYQPQKFDIRVPTGIRASQNVLEIITNSLRGYGQELNLKKMWEKRLGASIETYELLLNFQRMERYYQSFEESLALKQSYHRYRIYNWPDGDCSPRITFFDCGDLHEPDSIYWIIGQFSNMQATLGGRWKIVGQTELVETAGEEARQRVTVRTQNTLVHQEDAHHYLGTLPLEGPLRVDVKNFIEFLPATLGQTLELGSGNGQLASVLCSRAIQYICLDLNVGILLKRYGHHPLYGLLADINWLPFLEESFQSVIANNILEHSSDPLQCLQEIWRVLKPGGKIYCLIPLDALNVRHQIRTHYWITDMQGIKNAFHMARYIIRRQETINLYELGVAGCFPSCNGLVAKIEAEKFE